MFYGKYGTYTDEYNEDQLIEQKNYDTSNILVYKNPLNIEALPKTSYRLKSNKSYFDQDRGDTIYFINPALPPFNYGIETQGVYMLSMKEHNARGLKVSRHSDSLEKIMIKIKIYKAIGETERIPDRIDTIIIPVN